MSLTKALEDATSVSQLICLLIALTGNQLIPHVIFESDGELKSFESIHRLVQDQIEIMGDSPLLTINLEQAMTRTDFIPVPRDDDLTWFENRYQFQPSSPRSLTAYLLEHNFHNLGCYIDSSCNPWSDIKLQIAYIRATS
jgi:hypothetical protein